MFDGFKTRADKFVKVLDQKDVSKIIFNSIITGEEVVYIPYYHLILSIITRLLPATLMDRLILFLISENIE